MSNETVPKPLDNINYQPQQFNDLLEQKNRLEELVHIREEEIKTLEEAIQSFTRLLEIHSKNLRKLADVTDIQTKAINDMLALVIDTGDNPSQDDTSQDDTNQEEKKE